MQFFKIMLGVVLAFTLSSGSALASLNQSDITNMNNAEPPLKNARDHGYKIGFAKCVFDPSGDSSDRSIAAHGCGLTLPKKAIVVGAWYKVLTTFTSATDAATIAIKVASANDVVNAIAISDGANPWDAGSLTETIPKIDTLAGAITTTVPSEVTFTVAVEALTAGKLVLFVQYWYYGDV